MLDHALMQFPNLEIVENTPSKGLKRVNLLPVMRDYAKPQLFEIAWEVANRGMYFLLLIGYFINEFIFKSSRWYLHST